MIKDRVAASEELFKSGFHCSQAVVAVFSEDFGLARDMALKVSCPFGGGMGGLGGTCGALTGGMMVVGLMYGSSVATDAAAKTKTRQKTRELIEAFKQAHGTCTCNELVGFDRSQLAGAELQAKRQQFQEICPKYLATVVTFLEERL
jgi:C_GCAxxG_C_C family probable redox protein